MKIKEKKLEKLEKLGNAYIDYANNKYYPVENYEMHYMIANKICDKEGWKNLEDYGNAEQYLLHKEGFIKVYKYCPVGEDEFHYLAFSENFSEILGETVEVLKEKLGLEVIVEKDPKSKEKNNFDNWNR